MRKRLLIITYYWPPAGGGGVQRWLKFTKYLRKYGYEPVIFTVKNAEYPVIDESLVSEIPTEIETHQTEIWEPYSIYKKFTGRKKGERVYSGFINENKKESFTQKVSVFIRGNFFIPDARKFWIKPAVNYLKKYLKENPVDAMVSTGPPHTTHLIALGIKEKMNIPWVADFRDPWTHIDFYDQLKLTSWGDSIHKRLEKKVLDNADKVVTVSWSWGADFKSICGREDIEIITNGFDAADFEGPKVELSEKFSICHIGSMNKDRNPVALWKVLNELLPEMPTLAERLEILLIGQVDFSILQAIESYGLTKYLNKVDFIPHQEVLPYLKKSQVLLLPINNTPNSKGVLPGKLYEYLGAQRPILCIGPKESDAATILQETGGQIHDYKDHAGLKKTVQQFFEAYKEGKLESDSQSIAQFSRENLAAAYAKLLDGLLQLNT